MSDIFNTPERIELQKYMVRSTLPILLHYLIEDEILKEDDLSDRTVIMKKLAEHSREIIRKMKVHVASYDMFLDACKFEFENNRPEAGIIMASVCIENMLNIFYREMLEVVHSLKNKDVERVFKVLSIPDKIGWFLKVAFGLQLSEKLVEDINEVNSLRNKIVHFKAVPNDGFDVENGTYSNIQQLIKPYTAEQLELIIYNLQAEFENGKMEVVPSYRLALETIDKELKFLVE